MDGEMAEAAGRLLRFDTRARGDCGVVAGIDEAGRGPLAGPLVASAVVLPPRPDLESGGLLAADDSKRLSDGARRRLLPAVLRTAVSVGLGWVGNAEIDALGMSAACRLAFLRAHARIGVPVDLALVDGLPVPGLPFACRFVVRGDSTSLSIACASIVAKVTRDDYMVRMEGVFPGYGFSSHKGYGTSAHMEALARLGPSPIHRRSFSPLRDRQLELGL
jgi:ribonuclease HII